MSSALPFVAGSLLLSLPAFANGLVLGAPGLNGSSGSPGFEWAGSAPDGCYFAVEVA